MTQDDLNQFRGVIKEELKPVIHKLDILWDQVVKVSEDLSEVQETQDSHTATLKQIVEKTEHNGDDIIKLDKRTHELEGRAGVVPPPELTIVR